MPSELVSVSEDAWKEFVEAGGRSVDEAIKIYAGILKGLCVAVDGTKSRRLVRVDEIDDLKEILEFPSTNIYPVFEFSPQVLRKFAELAMKYVDEDEDSPESSPAVAVRKPGEGVPKYLVGEEKNADKLVEYLLAGYRASVRIVVDGRIGFVGFGRDIIDVTVF